MTPNRSAIYTRISRSDDGGISLGVQRQEVDCRALAQAKGWGVAEVLVDDDVSAYTPGKRQSYARLIEGIKANRYDGLVVYDLDRLHRHPWELEEFFRVCDAAGLTDLASVAGDFDLATNDGRLMARIMGAVAKKESDDKSRRLRRKHTEIAEDGRWPGGTRPYGYELLGGGLMAVVPKEAKVIAEMARRCLAGESAIAIAGDLNDRGVPTTRGGRWHPGVVRHILTSGVAAGWRRQTRARWEPILDDITWHRLRAQLINPGRARGPVPRTYLLTGGIARCGNCGEALHAQSTGRAGGTRVRQYACLAPPTHTGCGRLGCVAEPFEEMVVSRVIPRVEGAGFGASVQESDQDAVATKVLAAVTRIEAKLAELAQLWAADEISRADWLSARGPLEERLRAAQSKLAVAQVGTGPVAAYVGSPGALGRAWDGLDLSQRKAIVASVVDAVVVGPRRSSVGWFDPGRVTIVWRSDDDE